MTRFRTPLIAFVVTGFASLGFYAIAEDSPLFKINKSLQTFGEVFRQISMYYVDDIDPEKFIEAGIEGMTGYLDPYTTYIPERESDDVDILTTGVYGGLGVTVAGMDSMVTIVGITEGYAAEKAGLRIGDRIYAVDSTVVLHMDTRHLQNYTRGKPGTTVSVRVLREGLPDTLDFTMAREEIAIKNVTFSGLIDSSVGYIKLERFSRSASSEVREALANIRLRNGNVQGIILDLRDNPGGLLDAAVSISEAFVPTNSLIVYTPSGRCIQKVDYNNRRSGIFARSNDSLKQYKTIHGRPVYESNGIKPDTLVRISQSSDFVDELVEKNMVFNFATEFAAKQESIPSNFVVSKDIIQQFSTYLRKKRFAYSNSGLHKVHELREIAERESYASTTQQQIQRLEDVLVAEQGREIERNKDKIAYLLGKEIYARFYPRSKLIEQTLNSDIQVKTATSLLQNNTVYHAMIESATGTSNE